ncbi:glutaredoxin family protein [Lysinibacillus boronitolerans]|uniref:glutaredoxin family protein n=1 Tax=Lysinibacillus boronitolerans TaxID=309788 RepID=UPI00030DFF79|nr:glutaredoxin family protein [Lysinibacillus boronitolerans]
MKYDITVYSSDGCQYCIRLKDWLEENNITYINKDINEEHVLKEFKQFNIHAIPFTLVVTDNKVERIIGYQPGKIKAILDS